MTVFQMDLIWCSKWDLPADHRGHTGDHANIGLSANGRWRSKWKGGGEAEL